MNQKLTLENAGDHATFTVSSCRMVDTKFGCRMVFSGIDEMGTEVETPLMPEPTAQKQLSRLGLDSVTCIGETLTFSRAANPTGKPYWNIDPAGAQPKPSKRLAPPSANQTAAPAPSKSGVVKPALIDTEAMQEAYLSLWDRMAQGLSVSAATYNIPLTADAVQAATATLWIAFNNRGVMLESYQKEVTPAIPTTPPPSGKRIAPPNASNYDKFPAENSADNDLPF